MAQIINVTSAPNQTLTISPVVDGNTLSLSLSLSYYEMCGYWVMSITDVNGNLLLDSVPLLTGSYPAANILAPYAYLAIGSCYLINQGSGDDVPTSTNLGTDFQLLWGDTAA